MINDILPINNPFVKLLPETTNVNNDILQDNRPSVIHEAYRNQRLRGVILRKESYPYNRFAQYNYDFLKANQEDNDSIIFEDTKLYGKIKGAGAGKRFMGHHSWFRLDPTKGGSGAQSTGDCVSWAIRGCLDRNRCMAILKLGRWEEYRARQATCGIYSGRGHTGQGADPVGLSAWAVKIGTLLEMVYKTTATEYDFREYSKYVSWGMTRGRTGMPNDLLEQTKQFTAGGYKIIKTTEAARDFMFAFGEDGGTVHCGSDLGVSSSGNPVSKRSGSWSHDMDIPGYDDTKEFVPQSVFLWDQSWGNWNTVTNIPEAWKPWLQGMFALPDSDTQWALNDGGCVGFLPGKWFGTEIPSNQV